MALFGGNSGNKGPDPSMRMGLGVLIGGYLCYLGYGLLKSFAQGEEGIPGWAAILFGALFIGAGGGYLVYQVVSYRKYMQMKQEEEAAEASSETLSDEGEADEVSPSKEALVSSSEEAEATEDDSSGGLE